MSTINTANYTVGQGSLYFNTTIANASLDASPAGFRHSGNSLGNIVSIEINPEVTYLEHFVTSDGKKVKDKIVEQQVAIMVNFTFDEMNEDNLARFLFATETASVLSVLNSTTDEGSAILYTTTSVGRDLLYKIPKCSLRPDGPLPLNAEDWWQAPMVLEVLRYQTADGSNATWLAAPFGTLTVST